MKVVVVTWLDANQDWTQRSPEEAERVEPVVVKDAGVLLVKNKEKVVIAHTWGQKETDDVRNILTIPRAMVMKVEVLG